MTTISTLITAGDLSAQILRAGRINGPALLFDAWYSDQITPGTLAALIGDVWSMAEYPDRALDRETWVEMFQAAGYTADGKPAEKPTEPIRLWRGSTPARRRLMSWTTDRAVAAKFAAGIRGRAVGRVWTITCPPAALLAANTGRGESEYVVDTRGLAITEDGAA